MLATLIIHCKFQPFLRNWNFNIFPIQMHRGSSFEQTWMTLSPQCYVTRFSLEAFLVLEKKIFKCFDHMWAWQPSCLIMQNLLNKLIIPLRQKAQCEIWWKLVKLFQRRRLQRLQDLIHVYSPGAGGQHFDCNWKGLLLWSYIVSFSH